MMSIMARFADAWNADRQNDLGRLLDIEREVDAACIGAGRDPSTLRRIVGIQVDLLNDRREPYEPRQWIRHPWPLTGTTEELAEQIQQYTRAKCDHLIVWIDPASVEALEALAPVLELLDRTEVRASH